MQIRENTQLQDCQVADVSWTDFFRENAWSLAFSGGGVRGVAHLGVLQAFLDRGLRPTSLSGCSSGALVGAFFAAGLSPHQMLEMLQQTSWQRFVRLAPSRHGLLDSGAFLQPFQDKLPHTFEELELPLFVSTMDLATGETLLFSKGELLPILRAAIAIPLLCRPVRWQGQYLYDGGLVNNLPVEPFEQTGNAIVGIHTNHVHTTPTSKPLGFRRTLERIFQISISQNVSSKQARCTLWIEPPSLGAFSVFDFDKAEEIFYLAYEYTNQLLETPK